MDSQSIFPAPAREHGIENDRRTADMLNSILLIILLGCGIALLLVPFLTPERLSRLIYIVFVFLTALATRLLMNRGHVRAASVFLLTGVWVIITAVSFTGGGLRSPTFTGGQMVIIAAGGLLLDWRGAILFSVLGSLTGLFLFINDAAHFVAVSTATITSAALWIGDTVFFLMIALLFGIAIRRIHEAFSGAQANEQALRESEERFRAFMDTSPAIVIMKDAEGRYVYGNAPFEKFIGIPPKQVIGKTEFDIFPLHEAEQFIANDREVLKTGQPIIMEYRAPTPSGALRDWWAFKFPLTSPSGQKYVGVQVLDITDRKQMERERETLIKDLEARNAELEQFTYTVSHDLKSPLVTIRGFLGLLEEDLRSGDQQKLQSDMQRIINATEKMQRLLAELLELSRIGRVANPPEEVLFKEIVQEAAKLVAGQMGRHHIQVKIAPELPTVNVDRVRLVQVMQNLMDNAAKFMEGQSEPQIEIGVKSGVNGASIFFVRDNGIGIEPQFHERIFGLFNKLDPLMEGTGIGLALVKRIIEVHGGRIWVESEGIGKGSTFCFTL